MRPAKELLIGTLFGARLALEELHDSASADAVIEACLAEIVRNPEHFGMDNDDIRDLPSLSAQRFREYVECLGDQAGCGPMWHLGSELLARVTGRYTPELGLQMNETMMATGHIMGSREGIKAVLEQVVK